MPLDPGRHWLAAGITGLPRQREWDAIATADAPGAPGDEVVLVALLDGRIVLESAPQGLDATPLVEALGPSLEKPFRAVGVRREDRWAVGAVSIRVERLEPEPGGTELELTWDGSTLACSLDGLPVDASRASGLERIAAGEQSGPYAAHAHRIVDSLWEVLVLAL